MGKSMRIRGTLKQRFLAMVPSRSERSALPNDACWLWRGTPNKLGYGVITGIKGKKISAHRCSWILKYGKIPDGLHVLHKCDTPLCVRPSHLFLGTHQDNMLDKVKKGRQAKGHAFGKTFSGEKHGMCRLKADQISQIRKQYATGKYTQQEIATKYEIDRTHVCRIVNHKVRKYG